MSVEVGKLIEKIKSARNELLQVRCMASSPDTLTDESVRHYSSGYVDGLQRAIQIINTENHFASTEVTIAPKRKRGRPFGSKNKK